MEIGELVAVAVEAPHTSEGCPFCRPTEEVSVKNELAAAYDEDTDADNNTDNHSGTLALNLTASPHLHRGPLPEIPAGEKAPVHDMNVATTKERDWHQRIYDAGCVPVIFGAHHLIPGNAALKNSTIYTDKCLGSVDDGADTSNVGYNINSRQNGIWLPGSYAIRSKKGTEQATWSATSDEFQEAYAFSAMADSGRQFHDTHEAYSDVVRKALDDLRDLLEEMENEGCPECGKGADTDEPPYHLVSRLNAVSNHLSSLLRGDPTRWKTNGFASDKFGEKYRDFVKAAGGFVAAKRKIAKLRKRKFDV
jgi:hypothetical protein